MALPDPRAWRDWPLFATFFPPPRVPQLEADEAVVAHAHLSARGVALLTDRRLVVVNSHAERSVALNAMGAVEVGFERSSGDMASGLVLVGLAAVLFGMTGYLSGFIAGHGGALDAALRADGEGGGIAVLIQRLLGVFAAGVRWLPWLALCLFVWGGVRFARGIKGATAVNVITPMGEYRLTRGGRSDDLDLLGRALSRRFALSVRAPIPAPDAALPDPS